MRRLYLSLLTTLLPLAAAGQSASDSSAMADQLLARPSVSTNVASPGVSVPLWLSANGHLLTLKANRGTDADAAAGNATQAFDVLDRGAVTTMGLQYGLAPNLNAHAEFSDHAWNNQLNRVVGSEVGATYDIGRYSLGLGVATNSAPNTNAALPRVLSNAVQSVGGLPGFDNSSQINARGRLGFGNGNKSGIDLGASVGRVHLLPGNVLGISTLDQKALSFGVDHGPISGTLIGRSIEPQTGLPGSNLTQDRRWNSIDLGVTFRLPWRGQLSVGAQNLWSSGSTSNTPVGPEPDQSRTPYVQYHQDL